MASDTVLVEREGPLIRIRLNRPAVLNALNEEMHIALRTALNDAAADDSCRAVLLTGTGRGFCVGQDLSERDPASATAPPDLGNTLRTYYNPTIRAITSMQKPVIAAVNGVAAGAGANIALACDIVVATESARFIQAFSKIGLAPDAGGSWALARLLGAARAKGLALTAQPLDAETAVAWGLIWASYPDNSFVEEANKLAFHLANGPTVGLALTKQAIDAAFDNDLDSQLDLEAELQSKAGASQDYAEGVAAFLAKRPAKFTGS